MHDDVTFSSCQTFRSSPPVFCRHDISPPTTMRSKTSRLLLLFASLPVAPSLAFAPPARVPPVRRASFLGASASPAAPVAVRLTKPLGLILEEHEEGGAAGTYVLEVGEGGSARAHPTYGGDALANQSLLSVDGADVSRLTFDDVMATIIAAGDEVALTFGEKGGEEEEEEEAADGEEPAVEYAEGTAVTVTVLQEGQPVREIEARVGDNLRKTLLENKVELYRGLKKKLGNCGGGGQCTFCAVDMVETDGWLERSEYEDSKIPKFPTARLACLNNIAGPATIRVQ